MSGPPRQVSDKQILSAIDSLSDSLDRPVVQATEISPELPVTHRNTLHRLDALLEQGKVGKLKVTPSNAVWWLTSKGEEYLREE